VKIATIVLLCLVALSVIYGCSVVWLNYQGVNPTSFAEGTDFLKNLGTQYSWLSADPIDSPRPMFRLT